MFYSVKLTEMQYRSVQFHLISSRGRFLNFQAILKPIFIPYLRTYLLSKILYSLVLYPMFVPIGKKYSHNPRQTPVSIITLLMLMIIALRFYHYVVRFFLV